MRALGHFCNAAFLVLQVIPPDGAHRVTPDDEQILHRADLQHLLVKRRGTGRGFTPHRFHPQRIRQVHEGGEDTAAEAGNRLVRKRQAGANSQEVEDEVVTPSAAAKGEGEKLVGLGPFSGRDHEEGQLGAFVAPDGGAQFGEAGDRRAFAGVVEPAFGGERGKLARVRGRGRLPPRPHAPDFGFGGERQFDGPEFACGFDVEEGGVHACVSQHGAGRGSGRRGVFRDFLLLAEQLRFASVTRM